MNAIVTPREHRQGATAPGPSSVSVADDTATSGVDLDQFVALTRQEYLFCGDGAVEDRASRRGHLRSFLTRQAHRPSAALPPSTGPNVRRGRGADAPSSRDKATVAPASRTDKGTRSTRFGAMVPRVGLWAAGLSLLAAVCVLATKYKVALFG